MTFGPAYDPRVDKERLATQMERVRDYMLCSEWRSLEDIQRGTGYPQASISAQLRHLRKARFGRYLVEKRRRLAFLGKPTGTWEYRVSPPVHEIVEFLQTELFPLPRRAQVANE